MMNDSQFYEIREATPPTVLGISLLCGLALNKKGKVKYSEHNYDYVN